MPKDNTPAGQESTAPGFAPANYRLVGIEKGVKEVYVPLVSRSYVLADITPAQFEMLHRLGWPHVEKS